MSLTDAGCNEAVTFAPSWLMKPAAVGSVGCWLKGLKPVVCRLTGGNSSSFHQRRSEDMSGGLNQTRLTLIYIYIYTHIYIHMNVYIYCI